MKKNLGLIDKFIRMVSAIGIILLYTGHYISGLWAIVFLVVSGIFMMTSLVSFCPIYFLAGISTQITSKK